MPRLFGKNGANGSLNLLLVTGVKVWPYPCLADNDVMIAALLVSRTGQAWPDFLVGTLIAAIGMRSAIQTIREDSVLHHCFVYDQDREELFDSTSTRMIEWCR